MPELPASDSGRPVEDVQPFRLVPFMVLLRDHDRVPRHPAKDVRPVRESLRSLALLVLWCVIALLAVLVFFEARIALQVITLH
jgi:hypothetical protein